MTPGDSEPARAGSSTPTAPRLSSYPPPGAVAGYPTPEGAARSEVHSGISREDELEVEACRVKSVAEGDVVVVRFNQNVIIKCHKTSLVVVNFCFL